LATEARREKVDELNEMLRTRHWNWIGFEPA
jgi:hypothetical protein